MSTTLSVLPFSGLTNETLKGIKGTGELFSADKGDTLLQADQPWQSVFWLHAGVVRMFYLDSDGREHNKRFFLDGAVFWPVSTGLRTQPAGFYMEALTPISGVRWAFDDFRRAFKEEKEWLAFSHVWMERLLDAKLTREREWLHLSASERYEQLCRQTPEMIERVPAHHIASYLGITPVSLSRLKNKLDR